jgi:hypothetical protein
MQAANSNGLQMALRFEIEAGPTGSAPATAGRMGRIPQHIRKKKKQQREQNG